MSDTKDTLNIDKHLVVTVESIKLTRKSNYFLIIELEQNSHFWVSKNPRRTEVAISTATPHFRLNSFQFCLSLRDQVQCQLPLVTICKLFEIVLHKDNSETQVVAFARLVLAEDQLNRLLSGESLQERDIKLNLIEDQNMNRKPTPDWKWFRRKSNLTTAQSFGTLTLTFQYLSKPQISIDSDRSVFETNLCNINKILRNLSIGKFPTPPRYITHLMNQKYDLWTHSFETRKKLIVRCLGIVNVPSRYSPFFSVKTTAQAVDNRPARAVTASVPLHTRNAIFYDPLIVEEGEEEEKEEEEEEGRSSGGGDQGNINQSGKRGFFLSLVDHKTKKYLAKMIIPSEQLIPGEQYNFIVVFNERGGCLLLSLTLESTLSYQTYLFHNLPQLHRFEVVLHGVRKRSETDNNIPKDPFSSCPVVACLRIVNDLDSYIDSLNQNLPTLPFKRIFLADPNSMNELTPSCHKISAPSLSFVYPHWDASFEFYEEINNISSSAALVVEFFRLDFPKHQPARVFFCGYAPVFLRLIQNQQFKDGSTIRYNAPVFLWTPPDFEKPPSQPSLVMDTNSKGSISEIVEIPCQEISEEEYLVDAVDIPNPQPLYVDLELRKWSSSSYLAHIQKIHEETESNKQHSLKDILTTDSTAQSTLTFSKYQTLHQEHERFTFRPLTPIPSESRFTERTNVISNGYSSKLAQSSPANILTSSSSGHSNQENLPHYQLVDNKEANSRLHHFLTLSSRTPLFSSGIHESQRHNIRSSSSTQSRLNSSKKSHQPHEFETCGQKAKQNTSDEHLIFTQPKRMHKKKRSEESSAGSVRTSREGEEEHINSYTTSSSESDLIEHTHTQTQTQTQRSQNAFTKEGGHFNIGCFIDNLIPPSPYEENVSNPFSTPLVKRQTDRQTSSSSSPLPTIQPSTDRPLPLLPNQSQCENESDIIITLTLALAKIQDMLNAALVQKQQLINSLRRELFQCRNTIDALNEEKRDLIMQKQHSLIRKMFQQRKIDNEMFPDVSQLENMDKNEVLKKYKQLWDIIFQKQTDAKSECDDTVEDTKKTLQDEIEQLLNKRKTLLEEIHKLQEKIIRWRSKAYNRQLFQNILEHLRLVSSALQKLSSPVQSTSPQRSAALEREKDKQIESLTRRISELEEENRFIKRKLKSSYQSLLESLNNMEEFLSK